MISASRLQRTACLLIAACTLIAASGFAPARRHDIHISYCRSQVAGNVFTAKVSYYRDDLLRALAASRGSVQNMTPQQLAGAMTEYFRVHFIVAIGGRALPWTRIIRNDDGTSVSFDVRADAASRIASATIWHTAFFQQFSDQMNMMVVTTGGSERNFILTSSKPNAAL